jgi:hypothetical protein
MTASAILLACFFSAFALPGAAQGTKLWTQTRADELEKGTPQGVAITSDGKLTSSPTATELLTTPSSFVWSVVQDKAGTVYVATGSPATVLKINSGKTGDSRFTKLFETKALAVQALALGPDGALYAATMPDGKIYRLKTDVAKPVDELTAEVVLDLAKLDSAKAETKKSAKSDPDKSDDKTEAKPTEAKSRYIWDLTFDPSGRLYAATGAPGAVYRLKVSEKQPVPELFFKTDEQHIRVLAWDKAGNLLAGTDGSGLVYRISPDGKGYVLFSAPRREVTALAIAPDGVIYEADAGDKSRNPLPPLAVQSGNAGITISFVQPGSMQAANASAALPDGSEIYALKPDQAPRKIWSDKDDIVYRLAMANGKITALTGNRGRIFSIDPDGTFADLAHLDAQQAVAMAPTTDGWLVGTANTGRLYRLSGGGQPEAHSYASDVLDAGTFSRWGRLEVEPGSRGYRFFTRSGNVEQPARSAKDWGWSDWQPLADGKIASPDGRYLQWKVTLEGDATVSGIGVNYLPVNAAPVVDEIVVVPGARVTPQSAGSVQPATISIAFPAAGNNSVNFDPNANAGSSPIQAQKDRTAATVRWSAHDDNGDDLTYDLLLRGDGEHVWRPLKKGLTEKVYSFDAASLPDGGYQIKVVASDAPSHSPGEALTGEMVSDRFELDTTAPVITALKVGKPAQAACASSPCKSAGKPVWTLPVSFDAQDAMSPISHAEYSVDAGPWQYIEPVGGLSDAKDEHYSFQIPVPESSDNPTNASNEVRAASSTASLEHLVTVRVYDRHENMATAKVLANTPNQEK